MRDFCFDTFGPLNATGSLYSVRCMISSYCLSYFEALPPRCVTLSRKTSKHEGLPISESWLLSRR